MSTWDEKAEDHAVAHHTMEHQRIMHNEMRYKLFVQGARWQREALLSDDVIERAARHVNELSGVGSMACAGCGIPGGYAEGCEDCKRVCEGIARAALLAAIEGEQ